MKIIIFFMYLRAMFSANGHKFKNIWGIATLVAAAGLVGCASTGTPGGGLYDETPPQLRRMEPADGATGVSRQRITLHFDENIKLDNVMEKMTISPPQEKAAIVRSNAKTMTIELQDTLRPNTTYSIDLGDAVQDNNEGNPLEVLSFSFSTGDHIDSMRISGYLLNAADLEPITGAYVGIYPAIDYARRVADHDTARVLSPRDSAEMRIDSVLAVFPDSVLMYKPFERAGKTDALGRFLISGVAPGAYRIFALQDGNTNYRYDLMTEQVGFCDTLIVPSMSGRIAYDTVWADVSEELLRLHANDTNFRRPIDTIMVKDEIVYRPDNLLLRLFSEGRYNRYLDDTGRSDSIRLSLRFSAPMEGLPRLRVVRDSLEKAAGLAERDSLLDLAGRLLVAEPNPTFDTLSYWIRDSLLYSLDTLRLAVTYAYTSPEGPEVERCDTINFLKPIDRSAQAKAAKAQDDAKKERRQRRRKDEEQEPDSVGPVQVFMTLKQLGSGTIEIGGRPRFEVSAPLDRYDLNGFHLEVQKDTLWEALDFEWQPDSAHVRRYILHAKPYYRPGGSYRLRVDSAAMHDIYGHPIDSCGLAFKEKTREEYAHLLINVFGAKEPAYVELLNEKDLPQARVSVRNGQAKFVNVAPGKYYARLIEDANGNGRFDGGNITERRQPEQVFYLNTMLELRANWDFSQNWNVRSMPLQQQKPEAVKQNKPKEQTEKKSKNAEYYERMGITPPQTNTGTTTSMNKNTSRQNVR